MGHRAACLLPLISLLLAGCQTTGDPYADTIWFSSKKAEIGLEDRRRILSEEQGYARSLEETNRQLETQKGGLEQQVASLQQAVKAEELRLDALERQNSVSTGEARSLAARLQSARDRLLAVATKMEGDLHAAIQARIEKDTIEKEVSAIHQRIQLLLGAPPLENQPMDMR